MFILHHPRLVFGPPRPDIIVHESPVMMLQGKIQPVEPTDSSVRIQDHPRTSKLVWGLCTRALKEANTLRNDLTSDKKGLTDRKFLLLVYDGPRKLTPCHNEVRSQQTKAVRMLTEISASLS